MQRDLPFGQPYIAVYSKVSDRTCVRLDLV